MPRRRNDRTAGSCACAIAHPFETTGREDDGASTACAAKHPVRCASIDYNGCALGCRPVRN